MHHQFQHSNDGGYFMPDQPYGDPNWSERDMLVSMLASEHPATGGSFFAPAEPEARTGYPLAGSLGQFIAPLSEATLNGYSFQEAMAPHPPPYELSNRMRAIEDELFDTIGLYTPRPSNQPYKQPWGPSQPPAQDYQQGPRQPNFHHQIAPQVPPYVETVPPVAPQMYRQPPLSYDDPYTNKRKRTDAEPQQNGHQYPTTNGTDHNSLQANNYQALPKKVKNEQPLVEEGIPSPHTDSNDADQEDAKGGNKAQRSRESSRRYRQRKKECFEKMKKQLEAYEQERKQWLKERDNSVKIIDKLRNENEALKNRHNYEAMKFREERLALLADLDKKVRDGASDEELIPTLTQIKVRCQGIKQVSQNLLRQYVSPDAASYLASIGFFKDVDAIEVDRPSKEQSLYSFAAKLEADVPDLTEEQRQNIHALVETFYRKIRKLVEERKLLAYDLQSLYDEAPLIPETSPGGGAESPDTQKILSRLSSLQQLRENLITESDLSLNTIAQMLDVLKPLQAAKFLIKAHFVHTGVMQLQTIWEALKTSQKSSCPLRDGQPS